MKIGIVGWGTISDVHAQAIKAAEGCELSAVFTSDKNKNENIKMNYEVEVFNQYKEFLTSNIFDTVSICTPSGTHLDYALQATQNKLNLIIEKPLEVTIPKAIQIIKSCENNNVKLAVIYQNRYLTAVGTIKRLLDENEFGKIIHASAYVKWFRSQDYYDSAAWRGTLDLDGGGVLINQAIHTIDLLQYFVGNIITVTGFVETISHEKIEAEDSAVAILKFRNGTIGTIEASTCIQPAEARRIEIHCEQGTVILDGNTAIIKKAGEEVQRNASVASAGSDSPMSNFDIEAHKKQFEEITLMIKNNKEPNVTGSESLKSLGIVQAIYKSSKEGRVVNIDELL
ncbi:MAG: Gfo/Idh/MocA family oxidoreductase [Ignavibacterium sp.]|nr:MAG: Gfo/Idh/MocA family oxidoreductase [Ignavibacterium sp.]